jgi:hypothetical protein
LAILKTRVGSKKESKLNIKAMKCTWDNIWDEIMPSKSSGFYPREQELYQIYSTMVMLVLYSQIRLKNKGMETLIILREYFAWKAGCTC